MTLLRQPVWSLQRAGAAADGAPSSVAGGSTLPGAARSYHAVIDCFSEDCNPLGEFGSSPFFSPAYPRFFSLFFPPSPQLSHPCAPATDCAAVTLNALVAFAVLALALAQVATMLHKRIWLTWKFFLTAFLFVQLALLLAQQLFFHSPVWTFVIFFLKMIVLLFVLYFFAQYYFRVTSHSDELSPFVPPPSFLSHLPFPHTHLFTHAYTTQMDRAGVWRAHLLHGRPACL